MSVKNAIKCLLTIAVVIGMGWCIYITQPEPIEVEKYGVICNYKDKLVVMIDGEYCKITDADLYVYAVNNINSKIKLNIDIDKDSKVIMEVNGWYDEENIYHEFVNEEE